MILARRTTIPALFAVLAAAVLLAIGPRSNQQTPIVTADDVRGAVTALAGGFVPNRGQAPRAVRYHTYASSPAVAFTPTEAVVQRAGHPSPIRLRFLGANADVAIEARRRSSTRINYLLGNEPAKWVRGIPAYGEVVYRELWPGIDLAFGSGTGRLKYEVRVAAGASVERIQLSYPGARRLSLDARGNLRIHTARGVLKESAPLSYQIVHGQRTNVASRFVLHGRRAYGFAVDAYDPSRPLVIDPALHYSTFIGGFDEDSAQAIAVDGSGSAYVTGYTRSSNFPRTIGPPFVGPSFLSDGFVVKLSPGGDAVVYATFFGGTGFELGKSIDVDSDGNAYVVGETGSSNFPTTPGAYDRTFGSFQDPFALKLAPDGGSLVWSTYLGGAGSEAWVRGKRASDGTVYVVGSTSAATDIVPIGVPTFQPTRNGPSDGFVQRLNPSGSGLVYATYLGGSLHDATTAIALGAGGRIYLTGWTQSSNFPTTEGGYDRTHNGSQFPCCGFGDAYVVALDGETLAYGTFLGGRGDDDGREVAVAPGSPENVYVTGNAGSLTCCPPTRPFFSDFPTTPGSFDTTFSGISDAFVARVDPGATGGSSVVWSTFVGGSASDGPSALVVDAAGNAYAGGGTVSVDFPTTPGAATRLSALNFFVGSVWAASLNPQGTRLRWSSPLEGPPGPGRGDDQLSALALDASGTLYAVGRTWTAGFPVTRRAYDTTWNGGLLGDAFVSKFATTPQAQIDVVVKDLEADMAAGLLTRTQIAALRATLEAAKRDVERAHPRQAIGHLRTFISEVNDAAREGPLTAEEALYFMDEATDVILFVDYWLAGVGAPGPGPAGAGPQEPVPTVDVLVPAGLAIAPGETVTIGAGEEKADGLEAGCTVGDDVAHTVRAGTVAAPGINERTFGVIVRGDLATGTRVTNVTFVDYCTSAGRTYQVFRGNPES